MPNIDDLLFRREHFPLEVSGPFTRQDGSQYYDFGVFNFPPYHPSMAQEGIDIQLALSVLGESLRGTALDLEEVADKNDYANRILQGLTPDQRDGKINIMYESGLVDPFPIVNGIEIFRDYIHFFEGSAEFYIDPNLDGQPYAIDTATIFPEALMKEYHMRDLEPEKAGKEPRVVEHQHHWHAHNTSEIHDVFFKNFAIAYNNAVVRRIHQQ
ncbi:MAG: hypothetical protein EPN86_00560 [Nanoarchaeota archaeon]|nr:MAG: hypothetical protein EPN86_00560 [Nanoarchaeota archaeon]